MILEALNQAPGFVGVAVSGDAGLSLRLRRLQDFSAGMIFGFSGGTGSHGVGFKVIVIGDGDAAGHGATRTGWFFHEKSAVAERGDCTGSQARLWKPAGSI